MCKCRPIPSINGHTDGPDGMRNPKAAAVAEEAKDEVQRLRQALVSEEEACAEARSELEAAAVAEEAKDEVQRLRQALVSEEEACAEARSELEVPSGSVSDDADRRRVAATLLVLVNRLRRPIYQQQ
eukprot:Skav216864  [mRNA]  locus=scaffold1042:232919:237498:- [translate_table: standard]